jgi:hypothetical protein
LVSGGSDAVGSDQGARLPETAPRDSREEDESGGDPLVLRVRGVVIEGVLWEAFTAKTRSLFLGTMSSLNLFILRPFLGRFHWIRTSQQLRPRPDIGSGYPTS